MYNIHLYACTIVCNLCMRNFLLSVCVCTSIHNQHLCINAEDGYFFFFSFCKNPARDIFFIVVTLTVECNCQLQLYVRRYIREKSIVTLLISCFFAPPSQDSNLSRYVRRRLCDPRGIFIYI